MAHKPSMASLFSTNFLLLSVGYTFHIVGNLTTQIGSLLTDLGAESQAGIIQQLSSNFGTNCYFPELIKDTQEIQMNILSVFGWMN